MGEENELKYTSPYALKKVMSAINNTYRLKPDKQYLSLSDRRQLDRTIKELKRITGRTDLKRPTEETFNALLSEANNNEYVSNLLRTYTHPGYYTNQWHKGYKPWGKTHEYGCKTCGNAGRSVTIGGELPYIKREKIFMPSVKWKPITPPVEQPQNPPAEPPVSEQPYYYIETVKEEKPYQKEIIYNDIEDILNEINQFQTQNGWKYEVRNLPVPWSEEKIRKYSELIKQHKQKNPSQYQVPYQGVTSVNNTNQNYEQDNETVYTQNYYDNEGNLIGTVQPDSTNVNKRKLLDEELGKGRYRISALPDTITMQKKGGVINYINLF